SPSRIAAPSLSRALPTAPTNLTIPSSSHPDQNAWSTNTTANFSWSASDTSGIAGYAWCFDQANTCDPGTTASANTSSPPQTAPEGTSYMRVKAKNGAGVWTSVVVYTIHVDTGRAAVWIPVTSAPP